ncbi:MAG: glycosyl hydrolase [Kiritimatiellae bacterium]|nr:glycosyl hydrolase [Kiritimatiellia bacterium]MDD5519842.1 glycosyl hydrolase [Kiritimatiellia bacterium]
MYSNFIRPVFVAVFFLGILNVIKAEDLEFSDPSKVIQPPDYAVGFPSRDVNLDVLPGFKNPPPGYGEVPFWWWTGDKLNVSRMIGQIRELHKKGISGVQVNYSHYDTSGWLTDQDEPAIFSDEWWKVYSKVSKACAGLDMGIGLSTYTLDWPRGASNLFCNLFYSKPELNAIQLEVGPRQRVRSGETKTFECATNQFVTRAYPIVNGKIQRGGVDLSPFVKEGKITWTASAGDWEIWTFLAVRKAGSLNPLMVGSGDTVIRGFFQPFQDHNPGKTSKGLNYFFNDELHIGMGKFAWNPDFAAEFRQRKGYDLLDVLPAMWVDIGSITPKVRMDYADVRMALMEERYFKPIFNWYNSRGMIFACDSGGRGLHPGEFGDYFRVTRWYSAPGHDTPGGSANLIKGKVSSSIANLYQRPRVWLEGYHSLGWGATPERIMFATRENYLYGCTLLNLHGFYYTTYGSHWEWAPPCYHFRMPYWAHMDTFLGYFDRLSYLLSQGHFICDVAVVYPVAPYEAEMNGDRSKNTAFDLASRLMTAGINFEFIDNDSLARATVENGRLVVKSASTSYQALVVPDMDVVRWATIEKAAAFAQAGGKVYNVGALPVASERTGRDDSELMTLVDRAFNPSCRFTKTADAVEAIRKAFVQDVRGVNQTVRALHRKIGIRDIYMVMDAKPNAVVEFRAKGAVELWDPWTGKTSSLRVIKETTTGTQVELPLESYEAQIVVFSPGEKHVNPLPKNERPKLQKTLPGEWTVAFVPTMDNTWGDFRMPVTADNKKIGLEARRFAWARETETLARTAMLPTIDDSKWIKQLHGYGPQFYVLGPIPDDVNLEQLDAELAKLTSLDPAVPVTAGGRNFRWCLYDFSWRYGREGDLGHQGYHGLKRAVTDDFICLGKQVNGLNEIRYEPEKGGGRYYLWTSVTMAQAVQAKIEVSCKPPADKSHTSPVITPAAVYVNCIRMTDLTQPVLLKAGANPTLIRYDHAGRGHFVMRRQDVIAIQSRTPLAMRWYDDSGVIPFDVFAGDQSAEWFRFVSAPGTAAIRVKALGKVQAWINGEPMKEKNNGRFVAEQTPVAAAVVALRVIPQTGRSGGAVIPEPIMVETDGTGIMALGDWSQVGILNNYSGGVRYSTVFTLTKEEAKTGAILDLGGVVATAEVHLNGKKVGVRVAPPWRVDVTGFLKRGDNKLEVLVYNTLANHYQTIPSRYRGVPTSGLLGPVTLEF